VAFVSWSDPNNDRIEQQGISPFNLQTSFKICKYLIDIAAERKKNPSIVINFI